MKARADKSNRNNILGIFKFLAAFAAAIVMIMALDKESEVKADSNTYSLSEDELKLAKIRAAQVASDIMNADDFLFEDERAADYESIDDYISNMENDESARKKADEAENINAEDENNETDITSSADSGTDVCEETGEDAPAEDLNEISDEETQDEVENESIDTDDWRLILVNKQNPVPDGYDAHLSSINGSLMADERIIDSIYAMLDKAEEDGVDLLICSAYRSYDRQTTLFNNKMNKLMGQGMSYMEAYAVGSMSVTVPGTSEHQLGLALDILTPSYTEMDDGFGETEAGKWLKGNAPSFGFILRYPKGKEEITGIIYEPWHFRYVSTDYSEEITELGVTLEEYLSGEY